MWYSYLQYDVLASLLAHERSRFANLKRGSAYLRSNQYLCRLIPAIADL